VKAILLAKEKQQIPSQSHRSQDGRFKEISLTVPQLEPGTLEEN